MELYRNLCEAVVTGLENIFDQKKYADKVIAQLLKSNSRWGARDRRFIAETIYDIVRWYRLFIEIGNIREHDYWRLLAVWCVWNKIKIPTWEEFNGINATKIMDRYNQVRANRKIRESIPDWLDTLGENEMGDRWAEELASLNKQARVVVRVNTLKTSRQHLQQLLHDEHVDTQTLASYPDALILNVRQNIFSNPSFKDGLFEVQDAGSQLIAPFLCVKPGMRVIDACAGAGGKSLHLAAIMQNKGRIISMDTEEWKLKELKKRARRAHVGNIETKRIESSKTIKRLANSADRLLLDVPCSGLGVLKRNPDAKWKLTEEFIHRVKELQLHILQDYAGMLKQGGLMVYSTCSLFPSENETQVKNFLANHPHFEVDEQQTIYPSQGFDGFFMARLKRIN